jgi:hypothetical protein
MIRIKKTNMTEDTINLAIKIAEMSSEERYNRLIELKMKCIQLESINKLLSLNEQMEILMIFDEINESHQQENTSLEKTLDFIEQLDKDVQSKLTQN